jgi:opacity protein-like surface antigen
MNHIQHSMLRPFALATLALALAGSAIAADATPQVVAVKSTETRKASVRRATYPFRGEVAAVEGKSIVLAKKSGTRPIEVSGESLLERDGAVIRLEDVKPGDYLRGMLQKTDDGGEALVRASAGGKYDKPAPRTGKTAAKMDKAER